eukprot:1184806-Prorocentrum_minimum.AAC.1
MPSGIGSSGSGPGPAAPTTHEPQKGSSSKICVGSSFSARQARWNPRSHTRHWPNGSRPKTSPQSKQTPPGAVVTGGVVTPEENNNGPLTQALRAECLPQWRMFSFVSPCSPAPQISPLLSLWALQVAGKTVSRNEDTVST